MLGEGGTRGCISKIAFCPNIQCVPKSLNHCFDRQNTVTPVSQNGGEEGSWKLLLPIIIGEINYLWSSGSVLGAPEDTNKKRFLPEGHRREIRAAPSSDTHTQPVINDQEDEGLLLWVFSLLSVLSFWLSEESQSERCS